MTDRALVSYGKFGITPVGLNIRGTPTFEEWHQAGFNLMTARSGVQWAVGDWLLHADGRGWNSDQVESVLSTLNLKRGTLYNLKSIAKAFPIELRKAGVPWSHHAAVASLDPNEASKLLDQSSDNQWGYDEILTHAKARRGEARRKEQTWPEGTFGVLLVEAPWRQMGAVSDRPTMSTDDIAALAPKVQAIMAPHCIVYLWTPNSKLEDGLTVLRAWGATYRTNQVWVKDIPELAAWTRQRHELLLIGVRGTPPTPAEDARPDSVIEAPTLLNLKPNDVYTQLEATYPNVPKAEVFSRAPRDGWTAIMDWIPEEHASARGITVRE